MSAVLAALMALPSFVDDLLDPATSRRLKDYLPGQPGYNSANRGGVGEAGGHKGGGGSIYRAFCAIATEHRRQRERAQAGASSNVSLGGGRDVAVTPRQLKDALAARAPHFADNKQQDACEFFRCQRGTLTLAAKIPSPCLGLLTHPTSIHTHTHTHTYTHTCIYIYIYIYIYI